MPTTIPALRGRFGSTEYFLSTMSVGEFVKTVRLPREIPGWEDLSIEDRYQREINLSRVRREIAPYFASDEQRFSGALVLAVMNHDNMEFEPLPNISGGNRNPFPQLYQSAARNMGFLTFNGNEVLVPLDGQHRTKAFQFAIDGTDDNNRPIEGIRSNLELANDQVAVILVRFDAASSRRIFNKINRYAKPTTKADNLITDDDDAMAVITRELLGEEGVIPASLVRIEANNLNKSSSEFTTLATFYECNTAILNGLRMVGPGIPRGMSEQQRDLAKEQIRNVWE